MKLFIYIKTVGLSLTCGHSSLLSVLAFPEILTIALQINTHRGDSSVFGNEETEIGIQCW